jgi:hypothetical protein
LSKTGVTRAPSLNLEDSPVKTFRISFFVISADFMPGWAITMICAEASEEKNIMINNSFFI